MTLTLMDATAWTLALAGLIVFFQHGRRDGRGREADPQWGRSVGAAMSIVAMVQLMLLAGVLRIGFLEGGLLLPVLLLLLGLIALGAVRGRALPVLAVYAALLQILVRFHVIVGAA